MSRLYRFELKKIFQKKAFWVTLVLGLALSVVLVSANSLFDTYEYVDGSKQTAAEFYKNEARECGKLSGRVIDDAFIEEVRGRVFDFAIEKGYVTEQDIEAIATGEYKDEYAGFDYNYYVTSPLVGLNAAAEQLGISDAWYFLMDAVDDNALLMTINGNEFQKVFRDNIDIPESNSKYWKKVVSGIESPITYNYDEPMLCFIDSGFFSVWLIFILIALTISGAFADERSTKMDALIISSRKGRTPVAVAKFLAGTTVSVASTILIYATVSLASYINHGKFYKDAIIQMFDPVIAQDMTYGGAVTKQFICTLVMAILFTAVTFLLSELMGSTAVMGIQTGILMISFFNIPLKSELITGLWGLRPTHFLNSWVDNYSIFNFGTIQLNAMQMANLLYVIGAAFCVALAVMLYKKYQVQSR